MGLMVDSPEVHLAPGLFGNYAPKPGAYDELFADPGTARGHARRFIDLLTALGPQELSRRWEQSERMIHENGITYNAFGDTQDQSRPWQLDVLPLVIAAEEWRGLSVALAQRAKLLNLILADLYGPQDLLEQGLLPAEIVFAHPSFNRAFHGQHVPEKLFLHMYAADLARSPDGRWWVMADRAEAPSGAGYALENRIVISRTIPTLFHDCQVERLASYFIAQREMLEQLAPQHRENPRIVLLSQGPSNYNYFEDVYLARYLGYMLVEGGDLAVHNNRVMLKTLGGLLPVDVILRRLDDDFCDPLESGGNPALGVAGLLEAVRAGNVVVANALGSGLVESPAFMPFLPGLCRELLGEDLRISSVATWWCGDQQAREYVLANLDRLIIKPAYRHPAPEYRAGQMYSQWSRSELAEAISAQPGQFVAQERVLRSCTPVWEAGRMQPWHVAVRAFLVASRGTYVAMRGGLTRVSATPEPLDRSISAGQWSKDAWIVSERPVRDVSLLQPTSQPLELRRSGAALPSRVADNLFWLGRNVERAEAAARLLRTVLVRLTGESDPAAIPELPCLLRCLANQGQIEPGFVVEGIREQMPAIELALPAAVFDATQPGSLRSTLVAMHRVASIVRDRLSEDSWRIIHRIDQEFHPAENPTRAELGDVLAKLNGMMIELSAFSGLVMESMTRTQGWRFLDIGRRLERSLQLIGLVQNSLCQVNPHERAVMEAVLETADSSMTYRSRYLANLQLAPVLDLLLTDETNPRSLAFQLVALAQHIENLPRDPFAALRSPQERITMSALNSIRLVEVQGLGDLQKDGVRHHLDRLLSRLAAQLPKLSDAISHTYLVHAGAPRHLAEIQIQ